MDELDILRSIRRSEATPADEVLIRGQATLERVLADRSAAQATRATQATPAPRKQPRQPRRSLGFVLGGVTAAAALGVGIAVLGPGLSTPNAEAAVILTQAAERLRTDDAALADGQALRVEEVWQTLGETNIPGETSETPGNTIKYRDTETTVTEVPADRSADWVVSRSGRELVEVLDAHGVSDADAVVRQALGDPSSQPGAGSEVWPGGVPPWSTTDPIRRAAPTGLKELRAYVRAAVAGQESPEEESMFEWLLPVLTNPAAPAELRASGFELLAEFGSITTSPAGERTISMNTENGTSRRDLVFDASGELTEVREVLIGNSDWLAGLEPGAVLSSIRISSTVVGEGDSA